MNSNIIIEMVINEGEIKSRIYLEASRPGRVTVGGTLAISVLQA